MVAAEAADIRADPFGVVVGAARGSERRDGDDERVDAVLADGRPSALVSELARRVDVIELRPWSRILDAVVDWCAELASDDARALSALADFLGADADAWRAAWFAKGATQCRRGLVSHFTGTDTATEPLMFTEAFGELCFGQAAYDIARDELAALGEPALRTLLGERGYASAKRAGCDTSAYRWVWQDAANAWVGSYSSADPDRALQKTRGAIQKELRSGLRF